MQSSMVSKKFFGPTSSSGDMNEYRIKMIGSQLRNMQLVNDDGLEMEKSTNYLINVSKHWGFFYFLFFTFFIFFMSRHKLGSF